MALDIQTHVAGLSLSNTAELLESLGTHRSQKAIHDRVQKANLQPKSGKHPNQIVLDETVIRVNDQQVWLYAAQQRAVTSSLQAQFCNSSSIESTAV